MASSSGQPIVARARARKMPKCQMRLRLFPVFRIWWALSGNMPIFRIGFDGSFLVPNWNPVTPPELSAYAPVLYIIQPVQICLLPSLGKIECVHPALLVLPLRPVDISGTIVRINEAQWVRLPARKTPHYFRIPSFYEQPIILQSLGDLLAGRKSFQTLIVRTSQIV